MAELNWVDFVIIGVVALSAIVSLIRGLIPEVLSLATWIAAAALAMKFFPQLAPQFDAYLTNETFRNIAAFAVIFVAILIVGALINFVVSSMVKATGFKMTDRILGVAFGGARGGLVIALMVLASGLTKIPEEPWWQESKLVPHFERAALWIREQLPANIQDHFKYPPKEGIESAQQSAPAGESTAESAALEASGSVETTGTVETLPAQ